MVRHCGQQCTCDDCDVEGKTGEQDMTSQQHCVNTYIESVWSPHYTEERTFESSVVHILHEWANACVVYNKRTLQAFMQWGDLVALYIVEGILLAWFGSTHLLRARSHCRSTQSCSEWSSLSWDKHFYLDGSNLFQDDSAPIHWAWGITESFDKYEIDVS